jgi:hypothetical protein
MRKNPVIIGVIAAICFAVAGSNAVERKHPTRDFMRHKLGYTVGIVEGITLEKYDLVMTNAALLRNMNLTNAFLALKNPYYVQNMTNFQANVDDLIAAAKDKELEKSKAAYTEVINSCVACHQTFRKDQALK